MVPNPFAFERVNPLAVPATDCRFDMGIRKRFQDSTSDDVEPSQRCSTMGAGVKFGRLLAFG
jgi:hypothetical protein